MLNPDAQSSVFLVSKNYLHWSLGIRTVQIMRPFFVRIPRPQYTYNIFFINRIKILNCFDKSYKGMFFVLFSLMNKVATVHISFILAVRLEVLLALREALSTTAAQPILRTRMRMTMPLCHQCPASEQGSI